ncbi:MAG: PilN domain-containing protein [Myxococcota bacterium]
MADLDLVPVRYQGRRRARTWFLRMVVGYALILVALIGFQSYLKAGIAESDREMAALEIEQARLQAQANEKAALETDVRRLEQHLKVLDGLRGGISSKKMFEVVDAALDDRVWFRSWDFRRAGEIVDTKPQGVEKGYFILLPKENPEDPERTWRLETHMEIMAEAKNHSALGSFVRRLSQRPEIETARILNTQTTARGDDTRVNFELAVVVRSRP